MIKNNLSFSVSQKKLLMIEENAEYKESALKRLGKKLIGFIFRNGRLENNSGHHVGISGGYFHLFHNNNHTGVSWPEDGGFISRVKDFFMGKKK